MDSLFDDLAGALRVGATDRGAGLRRLLPLFRELPERLNSLVLDRRDGPVLLVQLLLPDRLNSLLAQELWCTGTGRGSGEGKR